MDRELLANLGTYSEVYEHVAKGGKDETLTFFKHFLIILKISRNYNTAITNKYTPLGIRVKNYYGGKQ